MNKNYNFERKKLMLPEYGRHIHEMVGYLSSINDRNLRNQQAQVVIEVMGNLNPTLRDTEDFKHKLWDHLFIMSDFKLDVDSPYPKPSDKILHVKPDTIPYPKSKISRKHYGKNIEQMLSVLKYIENQEAKTLIASNIVKYMRAKSFEYNQEYPHNEVLLNDIKEMSDHSIQMDENTLNNIRTEYKQPRMNNRPHKTFAGSGYSNNKQSNFQNNNKQGKRRSGGKNQHGTNNKSQ